MRLGIPRGYFYYDYMSFIKTIFNGTGIDVIMGEENNEEIMAGGSRMTVDEACLPIKLFVGQVDSLCDKSDLVLIPRIMKDCRGRWLCPKLLGIPELSQEASKSRKLLVTEPLYFDNEKKTRKSFRRVFKALEVKKDVFEENFLKAYTLQKNICYGKNNDHIEAAWEFCPTAQEFGEIILPNTKKVFLAGHCYNVYDKFSNRNIIKKLDDLGIEVVTDKNVNHEERERAVEASNLVKEPFWESFIRVFGSAVHLRNEVDGIVYLSSFSCGPDSFIIEMIRTHIKDLPIIIIKLDEHRGEAGFETRLEAFNDLLERRKVS